MAILENRIAKILITRFKANDESQSPYYFWVLVDLIEDGQQIRELISSEKGDTGSERLIELLKEAEQYQPESVVVAYNKKKVLPHISDSSSTTIKMNDSMKSDYESMLAYVDEKYANINKEQDALGSLGEVELRHTQDTIKRDAREQITKMQHDREIEKLQTEINARLADFEEQKTILLKLEQEKESIENEFELYRSDWSGRIKDNIGPLAAIAGGEFIGKILPGAQAMLSGMMGSGINPSQALPSSQAEGQNTEVQSNDVINGILSSLASILPTLSVDEQNKIAAILAVVIKDSEALDQIYSLIYENVQKQG